MNRRVPIYLSSIVLVAYVVALFGPIFIGWSRDRLVKFYSAQYGFNDLGVLPIISNYDDPTISEQIRNATKKKIKITVVHQGISLMSDPYRQPSSYGTGFAVNSSRLGHQVILTARHVIFGGKDPPTGSRPIVDPSGVSTVSMFQYRVFATIGGATYPLSELGVGEYNTPLDFIAFRLVDTGIKLPELKLSNSFKLGESFYFAGYAPQTNSYNAEGQSVVFDIIEGPYVARLDGVLMADESAFYMPTQLLRFIHGDAEFGFSGGAVFNKDGDVVGMLTMFSRSYKFQYAISARDLENFLDSLPKR